MYAERKPSTLSQKSLFFTRRDPKTGLFLTPPLEELQKLKFVVCTNLTAASLTTAGLEKGFFSHIIIDEAAQAIEAELLVPMSLADSNTKICLFGDHQQTGPRIMCSSTSSTKLQKVANMLSRSLLRRLSDSKVYEKKEVEVCRSHFSLVYRCHPDITKALNVFYPNCNLISPNLPLHAHVSPLTMDSEKRFFSISHMHTETVDRSGYSYNEGEANEVRQLVVDILDHRRASNAGQPPSSVSVLEEKDICVITPNSMQTNIVRKLLRENGLGEVVVHNLDSVQGTHTHTP